MVFFIFRIIQSDCRKIPDVYDEVKEVGQIKTIKSLFPEEFNRSVRLMPVYLNKTKPNIHS